MKRSKKCGTDGGTTCELLETVRRACVYCDRRVDADPYRVRRGVVPVIGMGDDYIDLGAFMMWFGVLVVALTVVIYAWTEINDTQNPK